MAAKAKTKPDPKTKIPPQEVIRSKWHGCFVIRSSSAWGHYLQPVKDPEGKPLSKFEREGMQLIEDFPKVPPELWSRVIGLYFYMCPPAEKLSASYHDNQLEVQVCLLRDAATLKEWKIVVPKQVVSATKVKSELNTCVDIVTGEKYDQFPPQGWVHAGSSHSHNTMDAFFSGTDDKSELTVPGLHVVVGNIDHEKMEYTYQASVVLRKLRKEVELGDVVDIENVLDLEFHENVLDYIKTVVTANTEFYSKMGKLSDDNKSEDSIELSLFDKDGKPDGFLFALNKENSDLFDEDSELVSMIGDRLGRGVSADSIMKIVEDVQKRPKTKYNEHCGECGRQVEEGWEECPNCGAIFFAEDEEL